MSDVDDVDNFYVFMVNFDDVYPLDCVKSLLVEAQRGNFTKYGEPRMVSFRVTSEECASEKIEDLSSTWEDGDRYDLAVLVVHAHETRLNVTEPGYGYNAAYEALRKCSGDRVLVVLGGDTNPLNMTELRSAWAQKRIGRQFEDEYMDGKNGLLLSWNERYQRSHVDAFRAFALPNYAFVSSMPPCFGDANEKPKEWDLIRDEEPKYRSDVNCRDSDSDDEPSVKVTETTAEISAPPSGKDTGSEPDERETSSNVSSMSSKDSGKAKSHESLPLADDEVASSDESKEEVVIAATLPIKRTFSSEQRGDNSVETGEEAKELSSTEGENSGAIVKPPSYEESGANIYPTVDAAKEHLKVVTPTAPELSTDDEARPPGDGAPEKKRTHSGGRDSCEDDETRSEGSYKNEEETCVFTVEDTKPPLPEDDIVVDQPSHWDNYKYVSRDNSKDNDKDACCLCFGGCWSGKDSVTDEDMIC